MSKLVVPSSEHVWYLDPKGDSRTNRLVGIALGSSAPENECEEVLCEVRKKNGDPVLKRLSLWRCPDYTLLNNFAKTAKMNGFEYAIYVRELSGKVARLWKFNNSRRRPCSSVHRRKGTSVRR